MRILLATTAVVLAVFFAMGAFGGPTMADASAQDEAEADACDEEGLRDENNCFYSLDWECDGSIWPSAYGFFSLSNNNDPTNVTITTTVTSRNDPGEVYTFTGNATDTSEGWGYFPGPVTLPVPAPKGSYTVTIDVQGFESSDNIFFDGRWLNPQTGLPGVDIDTDCVSVVATCSAITATLLDDGSDTFPNQFGERYLHIRDLGGTTIQRLTISDSVRSYIFDPPTAGIYDYQVYEDGQDQVGLGEADDPYGVKQAYKGSVAHIGSTLNGAKSTGSIKLVAAAALNHLNFVEYARGTVVCLQPTIECVDGLVTLSTSVGDATEDGIDAVQGSIGPITVNDGKAGDDPEAWPVLTFTFDERPDEIVFDAITHELDFVGVLDVPDIPVCIYDISEACDANGTWVVTEDPDDRLPDDTIVSNTTLEINPGQTVTYSVRGPEGSDNGVRFVDGSQLVSDITFTKSDCRTDVSIECVNGAPVINIAALAPPPGAFTNFTVNGLPVGNGGVTSIANGVDAVITSQPPGANVMLDAAQQNTTTDVTSITLPGPGITLPPTGPGVDCLAEASVICAADGDNPQSRPQVIVDRTGTLLLTARGRNTSTVWSAIPPVGDVAPGEETTLRVGRPDEGGPSNNGVRFAINGEQTRQIVIPGCQIDFEIVCGVTLVGDEGEVPNGRSIITYPGLDLAPEGTTTTPPDGADVTAFVDEYIELTVDNGVQFSDNNTTDEVYVDDCEIEVDATVFCSQGWPYASFTIDPFGETGLDVINGTETGYDEDFPSLTYRWDTPYVGADMTPQSMSLEVLAYYPDNVLVSPDNPFSVLPPTCRVDAAVACPATGANVGQAEFMTDLTGTPAGTQILDIDDEPVVDGQVIPAGNAITIHATNGVWFNVDNVEVSAREEISLTAPYCTITIEHETLCAGGTAHARISISEGDYELSVTNGVIDDNGEYALSVEGQYRFTGDPMTVTLDVQTPNAIVLPENPLHIDRPVCVVDVTIECVSGAAVALFDATGTPDTTIDPGNGDEVEQGVSITITATNGVYLRHNSSESFGDSIQVTSPACELTAELVCQTGEGGPTGQAVLLANLPLFAPKGAVVTPETGFEVDSEATLMVSVTNGMHFTNSDAPTVTLSAPPCIVTATAVAVCANGVIEVTVTTTGAAAVAVVVDGSVFPVSSPTTTITTLAPADSYEVSAVPADPANVVAAASEIVPLTQRCTIQIIATVACLGNDVVTIATTIAPSTTGTVDLIAVNGDSNLPYTVAPGTAATIVVTSPDTLPADISVPALVIPSSCDNSLLPLPGTLYVDYTTICAADAQNVIVEVTTEGAPGIMALSVNGDPAPPFLVTPASQIIVSVLTYWGNDTVVIEGPPLAPVCLAPTSPTSTPTPTPTPPPPAIIVTFLPLRPGPEVTTEPTTEPTDEPTPTPTPTPTSTVEPTPTPTPTPPPEPVDEPTSTPEPIPDDVLSVRTSLRQHGQSTIELPADCDVDDIDLPGAVRLVRDGVTDTGDIRFVADTATLDVGIYKETILCAGQQVDVELFVYRQIGGARGEANSISRLAVTAGVLTLVLIGVPGIIARREDGESGSLV